jgi:hypothetical protein
MANIKLKLLLEAEDFQAKSKETGKLVHFKSKDAYQSAIKAGTHENPKAKKDDKSNKDVKPNDMFGGDYKKDRGGEPKSNDKKVKKGKKSDSTRKIGWDRAPGAPYAEDDKFWNDRFLPGDKVDGTIATEYDFHVFRTAKIGISLNDWFGNKKGFNYDFSPTPNGNMRVSSENGPIDFVMFSNDQDGIYNFGFVDNDNNEFTFSDYDNGYFGGWTGYDDPHYVYQVMRYIMAQPETIQLLRGEITAREYQPIYEKFKEEIESQPANISRKRNEISEKLSSSTKLTSMIKK